MKPRKCKVLAPNTDLVADLTHELKIPITIIQGFAQTLQDLPELPRATVRDITQKIVASCQRMDNLVRNLLLLSDLENAPNLNLEKADLSRLIRSCIEMILSLHPDIQIAFEQPSETILASIDSTMLELAILNLLDNAVKYSHPPASIVIGLHADEREVTIEISDKGIGIAAQDLDQIFKRFYAVDKSRSRKFGGAGLGLAIARTIVEKHQGRIGVTSKEGKGTTFIISLPMEKLSATSSDLNYHQYLI